MIYSIAPKPSLPACLLSLCQASGRLFVLTLLLAFLIPAKSGAQAPGEERFMKIVQQHVVRCTWVLGRRTLAGKDLAVRKYEVSVEKLNWDGDHIHFLLNITTPVDRNLPSSPRGIYQYHGDWSYARSDVKKSSTLAVTEKPATYTAPFWSITSDFGYFTHPIRRR